MDVRVIFLGLDWSEQQTGKVPPNSPFLKGCTLPFRHCNSSSRPTTKLYLNKGFIGRKKKKQENVPHSHPGHALSAMPTSIRVAA